MAIASVSAKPDHADAMRQCAAWVADQLKFAAMETSVMETSRDRSAPPIVVAKNKHQPGRPTVLLYGHYDVQPPEPLDLWTTPPFEPTVRTTPAGTQAVYARGAVDDKGQVCCHLEAITAWQAHGGLPINLTVLIEGEEEVGSKNLDAFIHAHAADLAADVAVISDTNQFDRNFPALTYGLRGLVYEEIVVTGPNRDLHSGIYGGAVANPANVLAKLLAGLHDEQGRVTLPGFYSGVEDLKPAERQGWAQLPFDEAEYANDLGVAATPGEAGYSVLERQWARPTCDVNGITTGYQGVGAKTVIPSVASAKVSFRLVPHQDPDAVRAAFEQAMRDRAPAGVTLAFRNFGTAPASVVPIDSPATRLALDAINRGFNEPAAFIRSGGSIPVVGTIKKELGIDTLLVGFGLPDDCVHSPNEKFDLDALHAGTRTAAILYAELAKL